MRAHPVILATFVLWIASSSAAVCCTIPVFRFALDRWESDAFRLVLPQDIAARPEVIDLLRPLRAGGKANLDIQTARDGSISAPCLFFPKNESTPLWTGEFSPETLALLLDSPARQTLRSHILAGDSVTWVLVDAATADDDATAAHIEKRLKFLEQAAALPIQDPNDPDSQLGPGPPLKLAFKSMRLKLTDPSEKPLISMLAGPDGKVDAASPFAAAVFARGRVLGAWPLDILDDAALEEACMFLIGRCSCRVKNQNPGWDILMNIDWENELQQVSAQNTTVASAVPEAPPSAPERSATPEVSQIAAPAPAPSTSSQPPVPSWTLYAGAAASLALVGAFLWLGRGSR
ncbi:MAG: hypothetical protein JNG86_18225 [Verrucomicrobiaceae bacterium]|nr:hypothetical protein [Verrucomicrobiaceae bacterium]